jgi:phosphoglucosamine mutase
VVDRHLFGTSGVRGIVGEDLTLELCNRVARAIGTILPQSSRVCIATDSRISRDAVKSAVISGLLSTGVNVADSGILPTPALALITREQGFNTGIMITASHNPPEFNGIKLFNSDSIGYSTDQEAEVERIYLEGKYRSGNPGRLEQSLNPGQVYSSFLKNKVSGWKFNRQFKLVIDPGNGAASGLVSGLFSELGFQVLPLNDLPDGRFPGRNPEPKEDTLTGTVDFLRGQNADLAVCFDGDADRVVFCDQEGFLGFNEMIAFITRSVINGRKNQVVATTVETGRLLDLALHDLGVKVIRGKVGDVHVAHLTVDRKAAIGLESIGVFIIPEVGYYPDSIFAALTLLHSLDDVRQIRKFFRKIPSLFFDKTKVSCSNQCKEPVMEQLAKEVHSFKPDIVNDLDGLRLEFDDAWLLIRASGTEPAIRLLAESTDKSKTENLLGQGTKLVQEMVDDISYNTR